MQSPTFFSDTLTTSIDMKIRTRKFGKRKIFTTNRRDDGVLPFNLLKTQMFKTNVHGQEKRCSDPKLVIANDVIKISKTNSKKKIRVVPRLENLS